MFVDKKKQQNRIYIINRKLGFFFSFQIGMNLQICFMNETASDNESLSSDSETCPKLSALSHGSHSKVNVAKKKSPPKIVRPKISRPLSLPLANVEADDEDANFFTRQAQLQIEARMALAQAKDMAHMQMEVWKFNGGKTFALVPYH